jgi:uncharacterized paraquat-inducible protein A
VYYELFNLSAQAKVSAGVLARAYASPTHPAHWLAKPAKRACLACQAFYHSRVNLYVDTGTCPRCTALAAGDADDSTLARLAVSKPRKVSKHETK